MFPSPPGDFPTLLPNDPAVQLIVGDEMTDSNLAIFISNYCCFFRYERFQLEVLLLLDLVEPLEKLRMGEVKFPKEEDFFGAIQAVIRLQDTYELNMKQLTRGNILGRQTKAGGYYYYLIFERAIIYKLIVA